MSRLSADFERPHALSACPSDNAGIPQRPIRPRRRATAGKQRLAGPIAVADGGVKSNPLAAGGVACHGIREQSDYESASEHLLAAGFLFCCQPHRGRTPFR
jgi:hypothetical protein